MLLSSTLVAFAHVRCVVPCIARCNLRRNLQQYRRYAVAPSKSLETPLTKYLVQKIKATGPITVAEYMKEALTNPVSGYYMHRDVFGQHGDFTTSPEISQMFGEMLGIWCVNEWLQNGQPKSVRLVELGPGRGTLMDDLLRVFSKFDQFRRAITVNLVEVSPKLTSLQADKLCRIGTATVGNGTSFTQRCESERGVIPVEWYAQLEDVPTDSFGLYVAHEFFDSLPIHRFQSTPKGWREILVDVSSASEDPHHLRFILANGPTAASKVFALRGENKQRQIEVNPLAGVIVQAIAARIASHGGSALIADYGHNGEKEDTFRAFKAHQLHDPLCEPGTADLTADVDFSFLRRCVANTVNVCGPVTQEAFLHNMGIGVRLKVLLESAAAGGKEDVRKSLISGYDMMTNPQKMGERFKFFSMFSKGQRTDSSPAGFSKLT